MSNHRPNCYTNAMNWIILTLLAVLFRAIYGLSTRVLSVHVKVSPISQSVLLTGLASLLSVVLSPFLGGFSFAHFSSVWIPTLIMIVSSSLGNIIYFKGQEVLDAGTTQIVFSSIVIWGALLSITFLGSHFSFVQVLGVLLLLFAIILIQYKKSKFTFSTAVFYILASAFVFSIFQVSSAAVAKTLPAGTALPLEYIGSTALVGLLYWKKMYKELREEIKNNYRNVFEKGFFASGSTLLYFLFAYFAYSVAPDRGIVVLLLTTQVIVAVILGIIFLKEKDRMAQKIVAGILAVIASILIKA